ncbi:MAG: DsrE/DsrF/DrsH-like family protein [Sedimentisphaerales bacterium]|nr:DsrE/DsrF/DrsH-like family protein [Sedimentisphaerales bacterium]
MSRHPEPTATVADPALIEYAERLVTAKVAERLDALNGPLSQAEPSPSTTAPQLANRATVVAFSGDMDKLMAAFIIATGAAALGMEVSMYFTFWGLAAIKKRTSFRRKKVTEKLMGLMLPSGPATVGTSKMNLLGMGPAFFRYVMKKKNVQTLPDLVALARQTGVRLVACQMSMDVMGITPDELIDGVEYGGVTTYLADAREARITLFI